MVTGSFLCWMFGHKIVREQVSWKKTLLGDGHVHNVRLRCVRCGRVVRW